MKSFQSTQNSHHSQNNQTRIEAGMDYSFRNYVERYPERSYNNNSSIPEDGTIPTIPQAASSVNSHHLFNLPLMAPIPQKFELKTPIPISWTPISANKSKAPHTLQHLVEDRPNSSASTPSITTLPPAVFPRSISEACFDSASSKFRQLPCRTFISVGTCPYRERCVYLHDPRCICKEAKTKTRRKNKEDVVLDSLFWPVMPQTLVNEKLDGNGQPHVIQTYSVPAPQMDQYQAHDRAVYSMWMHFVDFCVANQVPKPVGPGAISACFSAPNSLLNRYTNRRRLQIFLKLSSGPEMQYNQDQYSPSAAYQSTWETPHAVESYGPEDDGVDDSMMSAEQSFNFVRRNLFPEEPQPAGSGLCSRGNASPVTVTASFLHSPSSMALTESDMTSKMVNKFPSFAVHPAAESNAGAVHWDHWDPLPQPAGPAAAAWNVSNDPYYDGAPHFTSHIPDELHGHFLGQNVFGTKLFA